MLGMPSSHSMARSCMAALTPPKRPPEVLQRLSLAAETPGLADPFRGLTTNGQVEPGLFAIKATGQGPRASGTSVITVNATIK